MRIRWRGLELPSQVTCDNSTLTATYGKFVAEPFERGFGEYLGTQRQVEEVARLINRAVPRKMKRTFEEPARSYAAGQPAAVEAWRMAAQRTAERGGQGSP